MVAATPLFVVFLLARLVFLSYAQGLAGHQLCEPFQCGKLGEINFPYTKQERPPHCGFYTLNCSQQDDPKIQLKEGGHWYRVFNISQGESFVIKDDKLQKHLESRGCESLESFGLPEPNLLTNLSAPYTVSLFKCNRSSLRINITSPPSSNFHNISCGDYNLYYSTPNHSLLDSTRFPNFPKDSCSFIQLPAASATGNPNDISSFFTDEFSLQVHVNYGCLPCRNEIHRCNYDDTSQTHQCAPKGKRDSWKLKFGLGESKNNKIVKETTTTGAGIGAIVIVIICCVRKFIYNKPIFFWKKHSQMDQNVEAFLRNYGPVRIRRYSYSDVKKMTNSFKEKLGQGGYGSVYKGNLHDGSLVAVKLLNDSKGNGEEFINEVATISRTSHVNIVALLGFCYEGKKRSLIYQFMPNGSLEKFIFNNNHSLRWDTLFQISLGIARGLEYLHRGCNTRILHFDIKPHNILLDEDFSPKISDFGLARVCTVKESIISMLDARGTIGYIAPEIFCREFGGVSHKSDVYSYGMMVLEMVGGRKNVNVSFGHTSEIYFPHWIYKRLELDEELGLKRIMNEVEKIEVKKMIMVSLWCTQLDPSNRPSMSKVIDMLEGSLGSLQMPPKPFSSSPSNSKVPLDSSSTFV